MKNIISVFAGVVLAGAMFMSTAVSACGFGGCNTCGVSTFTHTHKVLVDVTHRTGCGFCSSCHTHRVVKPVTHTHYMYHNHYRHYHYSKPSTCGFFGC